jgi:hypothetical protein
MWCFYSVKIRSSNEDGCRIQYKMIGICVWHICVWHKEIEANMCLAYDLKVIYGPVGFYLCFCYNLI